MPNFIAIFLLSFVVVLVRSQAASAYGTALRPLKVGCQMGQLPFADAKDALENATVCVGLFADVFYHVATEEGWVYTMTMIDDDHIDGFLEVNASKPTSDYDIIVSYHTINPSRLSTIQFSLSLFQTKYRLGLKPSYHPHGVSLAEEIVRDAVWYLFTVLCTFGLFIAIFYFIVEHLDAESELRRKPLWQRPLVCVEQAFESMIAGTTSVELSMQMSRTVRSVFVIFAIFVLNIFGGILTAQLTASSVQNGNVHVHGLGGVKIASASPALHEFLRTEMNFQVEDVPNIEEFAKRFYNGEEPSFDGYVAPSDTVQYLHNVNGAEKSSHAVTEEFSHHGTVDLKAIALAADLPSVIVDNLNIRLEEMRANGQLADLTRRSIVPFTPPAPSDIPIPRSAFLGIRYTDIVLYALFVIAGVVLWAVHMATKKEEEEKVPGPSDPESREPAKAELVWRGETLQVPDDLATILDAITASSANGRPKDLGFSTSEPEPLRSARLENQDALEDETA